MDMKRKSVSELCEVASKLTEELLKSLSINEALGVLEITKAQIDAAVTAHCEFPMRQPDQNRK